jgi:hypothetical protein
MVRPARREIAVTWIVRIAIFLIGPISCLAHLFGKRDAKSPDEWAKQRESKASH